MRGFKKAKPLMIDYSFSSKKFGTAVFIFSWAGLSFAIAFLVLHAVLGGLGFYEWLLWEFSAPKIDDGFLSFRERDNLKRTIGVGFFAAGICIGLPLIFVSCHLYVCAMDAEETLSSQQEAKDAASWAVVDDMISQENVENSPDSPNELYEKLVSIKGCGPTTAKRILLKLEAVIALSDREKKFLRQSGIADVSGDGPETWDEYFELLIKVPGCGEARARAIIEKWVMNIPETFTPKEQEIVRQAAKLQE